MRVLLTGASGFVGQALLRRCPESVDEVVCIGRQSPFSNIALSRYAKRQFILADLLQADLSSVIADVAPDLILNVAAIARPDDCDSDPVESYRLNVDVPVALAQEAALRSIRFVHLSTDWVFNGQETEYRESSPVTPVTEYGRQKAKSEQRVREACNTALICRLPLMFGASAAGQPTAIDDLLEHARLRRVYQAFSDEVRAPAWVDAVAEGIWAAIEAKFTGILHLGGPEACDRFQYCRYLMHALAVDDGFLKSSTRVALGLNDTRPERLVMVSEREDEWGWRMPGLMQQLEYFAAENKGKG